MTLAAFLATALMVGASASWHLLRGNNTAPIRKMLRMAMGMIVVVTPLQIAVGDLHGLNTLEHQPAKIAAMEGHWEDKVDEGVPLTLVAWPDMEAARKHFTIEVRQLGTEMPAKKNHFAIDVPHLGSVILTHSLNDQFPALKDFPKQDRPNATVVFWTFRVMVGLGLLMLALGVWGVIARRRGTLYTSPRLLRFSVYMGPAGLVALLAGWFTTEIGRQPWIVHDLMRTAQGVTPHSAAEVGLALALFVVVYFIIFGAGAVYILRLIREGPEQGSAS